MNNIILIATTNQGKLSEFEFMLKPLFKHINFVSLNDLKEVNPPQEIYETFIENAKLKANFYFNHFKIPVMVEDSGFCVTELNNLPGVHSANWGDGKDFTKGIERLYKMLSGKPSKAFFTSVIIYKDFEKEVLSQGEIHGSIAKEPRGNNGFGFDKCFIPDGLLEVLDKTFGEMTKEEKSALSHRKIALMNLINKI